MITNGLVLVPLVLLFFIDFENALKITDQSYKDSLDDEEATYEHLHEEENVA